MRPAPRPGAGRRIAEAYALLFLAWMAGQVVASWWIAR